MVLKIFAPAGDIYPYADLDDTFFLTYDYDGMIYLQFDISPHHKYYRHISEESELEFDNQIFIVKGINERLNVSTINAELNIDGLKKNVFPGNFTMQTVTFSAISNAALSGSGWIIANPGDVTVSRSIDLEDADTLDILRYCQNKTMFNILYKFDSINKYITIIKPGDVVINSNVYLTDELNLSDICIKGSSDDFCTRLYPFGKDGLDITSVNNGVPYIENKTYQNKIISSIWRDDRFTIAQSLYDNAVIKLKELANPQRIYSAQVSDLAKINPDKYGFLNFNLYNIITFIDRRRQDKFNVQVTKLKIYPANPRLNAVELTTYLG